LKHSPKDLPEQISKRVADYAAVSDDGYDSYAVPFEDLASLVSIEMTDVGHGSITSFCGFSDDFRSTRINKREKHRAGSSPRLARLLYMPHRVHMTDHVEMNRRNWNERAAIHARDITGTYLLDRFRAGEDALNAIEAAELGDVSGKRVLHLQCHIGRDTLCLVRRGAKVTGLDFSSAALNIARRLSEETGLKADFVEGTVDQAPDLTPGPFDLVFTTWGTICWLPDVESWAKVIASVLAPGGELYFADAHPGFNVLEVYDGRLVPTYDFQTPADRPLQFANETTYTGDPTVLSHQSTREWIHSLSAVLGGLIDAGLTITMFHEHEVLPWRGLENLVPTPDGLWRLPDGMPRIPLSYSVRAKKRS
jgi:2-polyprenyl-3-methyl-5-hydroxy-6-metoxy-1,4-benzoquinol methylase